MRRTLAPAAVAAALLAGACGGDAGDDRDATPRAQAEEAARDARRAAERLGLPGIVRETRRLIGDLVVVGRRLADDPRAPVGPQLADVERRARALARQAERELGGDRRQLGRALSGANARLAEAAQALQGVNAAARAAQTVQRTLPDVARGLRDLERALSDGR